MERDLAAVISRVDLMKQQRTRCQLPSKLPLTSRKEQATGRVRERANSQTAAVWADQLFYGTDNVPTVVTQDPLNLLSFFTSPFVQLTVWLCCGSQCRHVSLWCLT